VSYLTKDALRLKYCRTYHLSKFVIATQQVDPGDLRRHPEAPGNLHLGQPAAVPTSGQPQVPSEDPINFEFEAGDGEALQPPVPSGSQVTPTVTTCGAVGGPLQQVQFP
jgi:hypothetical protein